MVKIGNNEVVNAQCNPFPYMYQYNAYLGGYCESPVRVHGVVVLVLAGRQVLLSFREVLVLAGRQVILFF